jgi:hypothetical protein
MSKNQSSAQSAVEGELSLDDLEKIAGGAGDFDLKSVPPLDLNMGGPSPDDPMRKTDNMFTAVGANGTLPPQDTGATSMNLSMCFP